jgi:two-component system cell cycle sensor histidine kinase/response regulator CckA
VRRGTARVLRQAGYRVLEAANAGEALLVAEQHVGPLHALVTDVDMPRVSGPRLARRLQLARPSLQVLFVSGHGGEALAESGIPPGGATLLVKPFSALQLTAALRVLLDGA